MAKFIKGQSGNPRGRKKGSPNKRSITATAIAQYNKKHDGDAIAEIFEKMIDMAKDGDFQAARLLLERTEPGYKPQSKPIDIETELHSEPYQRADQILNLTTQGHITLEACKELLAGVAVLMKVKEQVEFENRLQALEQANANH